MQCRCETFSYLLCGQVSRIHPASREASSSGLSPSTARQVSASTCRIRPACEIARRVIINWRGDATYVIVAAQRNVFESFLLHRFHQASIHRPELIKLVCAKEKRIKTRSAFQLASHRSRFQGKAACDPSSASARWFALCAWAHRPPSDSTWNDSRRHLCKVKRNSHSRSPGSNFGFSYLLGHLKRTSSGYFLKCTVTCHGSTSSVTSKSNSKPIG